jgi:hypothetical protein
VCQGTGLKPIEVPKKPTDIKKYSNSKSSVRISSPLKPQNLNISSVENSSSALNQKDESKGAAQSSFHDDGLIHRSESPINNEEREIPSQESHKIALDSDMKQTPLTTPSISRVQESMRPSSAKSHTSKYSYSSSISEKSISSVSKGKLVEAIRKSAASETSGTLVVYKEQRMIPFCLNDKYTSFH